MSKRRTSNQWSGNGYKPGSHRAICDLSGFEVASEDLMQNSDGYWVRKEDYEPEHPQKHIRTRPEDSTVKEPVRPDSTDNTISVTFAESYSVPDGTFDNT